MTKDKLLDKVKKGILKSRISYLESELALTKKELENAEQTIRELTGAY